jgi:hypothetical protein
MNTTETHQSSAGDEQSQSLLETIPADLLAEVDGVSVCEYGFGAGPGCICGKVCKHTEGCSFDQAIIFLEKYRHVLRRAHIKFSSGLVFWFRRECFDRSEFKVSPERLRPGLTCVTPTK